MSTGYQIKNVDIDEIYESFSINIANKYGVTECKLTSNNKIRKNNNGLKDSIGKIFVTSSGTNIGGNNSLGAIKVGGNPVNIALQGCRPIGIPIAQLSPGIHYLNRIDNTTWLSSKPNSATGIKLEYNPKYIHAEVLGAGGGGGGSSAVYASSGGGGGGYCYIALSIPDNSFLQLIVGTKGNGGNPKERGNDGKASMILNANGSEICYAGGGYGGDINNASGGYFGESRGGLINLNGAHGGAKEISGESISESIIRLDKPETTTWLRGNTHGGKSLGNNYGGGGGASVFSNGANADSNTTPLSAGFGAGGAGAGFKAITSSKGGDGGDGLINLYY